MNRITLEVFANVHQISFTFRLDQGDGRGEAVSSGPQPSPAYVENFLHIHDMYKINVSGTPGSPTLKLLLHNST